MQVSVRLCIDPQAHCKCSLAQDGVFVECENLILKPSHHIIRLTHLQHLLADMSSVARVHKGTTQVPMQLTPQHSPHDSMSFVAEALASTKNIKEFAHTELRSQFPYIKTKDLEKLLAKTTKDLLSGLAEQ